MTFLIVSAALLAFAAGLIIAAAVLVAGLFAVVLYCALVDGARRRRYQDRVAEEWLERKGRRAA